MILKCMERAEETVRHEKQKNKSNYCSENNKHCLFLLSWAAVLHLAHIILGASAETEGL